MRRVSDARSANNQKRAGGHRRVSPRGDATVGVAISGFPVCGYNPRSAFYAIPMPLV
jgi:hypothetical protein